MIKKIVIPKTYYSKKILEVHFACCKKQPPKSLWRLTLQGETLEARSYQSWGLKKPISNSGCNVPQVRVWLCRALRKGNTLIRITRISTEKIAEEFKVFERPLKDIVHIVCNLLPLGILEKKSIYFSNFKGDQWPKGDHLVTTWWQLGYGLVRWQSCYCSQYGYRRY